ncbi:MAG: OBAP family protein [Opitutaceae bacterium]|nr:OBAP family protein [Opitutaceae bacterium]
MNPTTALVRLLGAAGAGWCAIALAAAPSPASREIHGAAAGPRQGSGPLAAIHAHVCGFHFYSGDMKRALRVDHYCSHLATGIFQCVIYDSARSDARLIGVEYIISEALFNGLPADEKILWHSHRYEVMSGLLTAPGTSGAAEQELMKELVSTYGKTWHFWQTDRGDTLPLGLPKLMMGFTADGQADPGMVADRDRALNIDSSRKKAERADFSVRPVADGADAWKRGLAFQLDDKWLMQTSAPPKP